MNSFEKLVEYFKLHGEKEVKTGYDSFFLKDSKNNKIELTLSHDPNGPKYFFGPGDWLPSTEYLAKEFLNN